MNHAEAQRRDDGGHKLATKIDLLRARNVAADLVRQALEPRAGAPELIEEAAQCLDRVAATRLARRLRALV